MPIYICAILLMIAADQAVKYWAFTSLQAQQTIPLFNGVFHLTYIENRGAAFSLFAQFDSRWIGHCDYSCHFHSDLQEYAADSAGLLVSDSGGGRCTRQRH